MLPPPDSHDTCGHDENYHALKAAITEKEFNLLFCELVLCYNEQYYSAGSTHWQKC